MDNIYLTKLLFAVTIFAITLGIAAYSTYFERKFASFFQDRIGPNRAGLFGILQPLADGGKLFFKEEFIPASANKFLFILGPSITMLTALMSSAVIPWGLPFFTGEKQIDLQLVDLNVGVLYVFAIVSVGVYGIMIGGWASNNKFSLLGAVRASSQMISYELAMGLSVISVIMLTGSMSLKDITMAQSGFMWHFWQQPLACLVFIICAFAECNRTPFDLPESESELIGGYHTEYSSMKMGLYLFGEYVNMFISSTMITVLFFGGFSYPGMEIVAAQNPNLASLLSVLAMFTKVFFFIFLFMWIRWTLPRFRYDQLMNLGWKTLLPLSIVNIIITGIVILIKQHYF